MKEQGDEEKEQWEGCRVSEVVHDKNHAEGAEGEGEDLGGEGEVKELGPREESIDFNAGSQTHSACKAKVPHIAQISSHNGQRDVLDIAGKLGPECRGE